MQIYDVSPKLYLAYDRVAYFEKNNRDLRISFDMNIRTRRYDVKLEDGDKMVYVNPYIYAEETTIPFSTTETYNKVKVMVWENLETCVLLCEAEEVPLN